MANIAELGQRRLVRWGLALVALVLIGGGWNVWQTQPDGRVHVLFPALDGDSVLIITPNGHTILVDGSSDAVGMADFLGQQLPFWQRSLDALILTRADSARLPGALAVARRYTIASAVLAGAQKHSHYQALQELLHQQRTALRTAQAGDPIQLDGVTLVVLHAATQDGGLVIKLHYGNWTALLAPHPDSAQATALIDAAAPATLLWWPWSRPDDRQLAERTSAAVIVYGAADFAHQEPRSFFERGNQQRRLLHKRLQGLIDISTDGTQMWIETELTQPEARYATQSSP